MYIYFYTDFFKKQKSHTHTHNNVLYLSLSFDIHTYVRTEDCDTMWHKDCATIFDQVVEKFLKNVRSAIPREDSFFHNVIAMTLHCSSFISSLFLSFLFLGGDALPALAFVCCVIGMFRKRSRSAKTLIPAN